MFRESLTSYLSVRFIYKDVNESIDKSNGVVQTNFDLKGYLQSSNTKYNKYSIVNTLAVPNVQYLLKDIYVTQTLVKENQFEENKETARIEGLPVELLKKYHKIVIKDTAGMGKSTIMKYMFMDLIDNQITDLGIPIYIELNSLNKKRTVLHEIRRELKFLSKALNDELLMEFIQEGGFVFFLDGYDEISIADRMEVSKDLRSFILNAGNKNYYLIASRPEDDIASFGDFQSFRIKPLSKEEAFELLTKYDISNQKKISKEIIKELSTGKHNSIDEYLVNPLLVSLLYVAFNYKAEIPLKKHQFYRQVYDALYNSQKLAEGKNPHEKHSGLDIDDFNRVLRFIGYECLISIGVQFDKDTILNSIKKAKNFCGNLKFGESDFLKDLLITVPLFIQDGAEYKWAHKSLMEYFAARFIAEDTKEKQDRILTAICKSPNIDNYLNMLDLYFDIDYKGFSKNITLPLCEQFVAFYEKNYIEVFSVDKTFVEERIGLLFGRIVAIFFVADGSKLYSDGGVKKMLYQMLGDSYNPKALFDADNDKHTFFHKYIDINTRIFSLLSILFNKKPILCKKAESIVGFPGITKKDLSLLDFKNATIIDIFDRWTEKSINSLVIDVRTGEKNQNLYRKISSLLLFKFSFQTMFDCFKYFDYNACKEEVENIRMEMVKTEKEFDSLDNSFASQQT